MELTTATVTIEQGNNKGVVGFILGLIGLVVSFFPGGAVPLCILGVIFSAKGMKHPLKRGLATAGLVLSIIGLVASIIVGIVYASQA